MTDYDELARKAREAKAGRYPAFSVTPDVILALLEERKVLREAGTGLLREWDRAMLRLAADPMLPAAPAEFVHVADWVKALRAALVAAQEKGEMGS